MSIQPSAFALLAVLLVAGPALAAGDKPAPKTAAGKKAADKAAADKAAADRADADKAAADKAAADKAAADKTDADKAATDKADADKAATDKADADKATADKAAAPDPLDPWEEPSKTYRFIGVRFREIFVPRFLINLFAAGGTNVNAPSVGVELISRRDHLEYGLAASYADYGMAQTIFRSKANPPTSNELVASKLKLIFVTFDILYEIPLERKTDGAGNTRTGRFALLVGGGVGLAGVAGNLYRSQAYPLKGGAADDNVPSQWGACQGAGKPGVSGFCGNSNGHFSPGNDVTQGYSEPSWAGGGSKPLIFPWIALPQISLRYKPIKQFQTKLDLGFSTSGFFFGLSASYGL